MDKKVESMATALRNIIEDIEIAESILKFKVVWEGTLSEAKAALDSWRKKKAR
jgi:hypothetical protein